MVITGFLAHDTQAGRFEHRDGRVVGSEIAVVLPMARPGQTPVAQVVKSSTDGRGRSVQHRRQRWLSFGQCHGADATVPVMPVRPATPADLDTICALIDELADYEHLSQEVAYQRAALGAHLFGPDPAAHVLIAETTGGDVAGMALWFRTFSTFLGVPGIWLEDLFVQPQYRGRGLGGELMARCANSTDGRVEWAVLDWNTPSIEFYGRLGASAVAGWTRYRWLP